MTAPVWRVAVIGSGISGLSAAWHLATECERAHVTLLEADKRFGGHAHTVDLELEGLSHGVDTGFLVFNERTYPGLTGWFRTLGVQAAYSDMSFSVQAPRLGLEWGGSTPGAVFAQPGNLLRPTFWGMLADILRFNRLATSLAVGDRLTPFGQNLGEFLDEHAFGRLFRDAYLLPMIGSIWSCPTNTMLAFPVGTLIRFCHNHGLLQIRHQPRWMTVAGGSREYVRRALAPVHDVRADSRVVGVHRQPPGPHGGQAGVWVETSHGRRRFDAVVLAGHAPQNLALLPDADRDEQNILGAIRTQANRAVLHTDASLLPRRRRAWAAWNYEADRLSASSKVCLHYLISRLQPLPWKQPVIVSLNPIREPDPAKVHGQFDYAHPVFDAAAMVAQDRLGSLQGRGGIWFAGAWTRYGFHEDGFTSGQAAARDLIRQLTVRSTALAA